MNRSRTAPTTGRGVGFIQSDSLGQRSADRWEARPLADSILHLIWQEHQISRAEIARRLGLSRSTVTEIIKELLGSGFVKEVGIGESSGGRRPIVLQFQNDARVILGIGIGATHVSATLMDLAGIILVTEKRRHPVRNDPQGTLSLIIEIAKDCLSQVKRGKARLLSIGVALPSPVDPNHPEFLSEVVIPAWRGRSELDSLHKYFGVPIYVDNDANLGALAEHRWGAGQGVSDLTYVKLAYGIGAGFILNGEIYRGAAGVAGEMGHVPVDPNGEKCICGLTGCLVSIIGGQAIEDKAKRMLADYPQSDLRRESLSLALIEEAALNGDPLAVKLYADLVPSISLAMQGWINMMNPSRIILGGSMAKLGSLLVEPLQAMSNQNTLVGSVASTRIRIGELGENAESIGAATLALEEVFSVPGFYLNDTPAKVSLAVD